MEIVAGHGRMMVMMARMPVVVGLRIVANNSFVRQEAEPISALCCFQLHALASASQI
jgi:hypothetical protein